VLSNPHPLLIRTSLSLALVFGFSIGLYLVCGFAFGWPLAAATPALMQVHGQIQALGFVAMFIIAVGVQLFPRFHASRLDRPRLVSIGGLALALGLVLRALTQPVLPGPPVRAIGLVASGILELAGVALAVYAFARVIGSSVQPRRGGFAAVLPATLGLSLISALILNAIACVNLAQGGLVVPFAQDEALVHLELWGFASTMALAVSGRILPKFLLLQNTREGLLPYALVLWAIGSLGVPAVWLAAPEAASLRMAAALAQLAGATLFVIALRLYELPLRASGMPYVTYPTRRWIRLAFAMMLSAAAADFGLALAESLGVTIPSLTDLSAARHALAQGFLLPLIVLMAARILPGYSGRMMRQPRLLSAMMWTLIVGAALRFVAELFGGYGAGWGALVALGGTLGVAAFVVFAVGLWQATTGVPSLDGRRPIPASSLRADR
jgi:hypothetical protein